MASSAQPALSLLTPTIGVERPPGQWHTVTQEQIDAFAQTTLDDQFIHTDPFRAARETPFGATIAHGFLTLSLVSYLVRSIPDSTPEAGKGRTIGINYGLDRVRFPNPVRVNSRIRARQTLLAVEQRDEHTLQLTHRTTIEIEGQTKPACVADWIIRAIYK